MAQEMPGPERDWERVSSGSPGVGAGAGPCAAVWTRSETPPLAGAGKQLRWLI